MRSWTREHPLQVQPPTSPPSRFLPGTRPRLIAHRGFALDGAENTLRAFADALAVGATMLETDTRATADGIALAVHDATAQRVAGDARPISQLRSADLPAIRVAGAEPLARLEDVLGTFTHVPINIDVKDAGAIGPAADAVARTGAADRVCITSFDDRVGRRAARAIVRATGVAPVRSPSRRAIAALLAAAAMGAPTALTDRLLRPYGAVQVPPQFRGVPVITPALVACAHRAGCEVHAWTIDAPAQMRDLLITGVDGIVTNRVDLLHEVLRGAV